MTTHEFDSNGYDLWGYDRNGHYNSTFDRAPFQASPHPTCAKCDNGEPCTPETETP